MFLRTIKEFNRYIRDVDRCAYCGHCLYAPPIIVVDERSYHANCGMQLAWRLLFAVTGEPDLRPIERADLEQNPLFTPPTPARLQNALDPLILQKRTNKEDSRGEPTNLPGDQERS